MQHEEKKNTSYRVPTALENYGNIRKFATCHIPGHGKVMQLVESLKVLEKSWNLVVFIKMNR